jgi:hypothetical protein
MRFEVVLRTVTHSNLTNCSRCWRFYPILTAVPNARSLSTAGWVRILSGVPNGTCTEPHSAAVERFLAMVRFEPRGNLAALGDCLTNW